MARQCAICEKKGIMVQKRKKLMSRYNPLPKKKKYPNLQWIKIPLDVQRKNYKEFAGKRILICAKCRKTLYKT
ncbi:MAG: hypothetical protein U9P88_01525 [Patescibacteria group bacterium]|nr:hypothetical protein [Patescibacteria group bacterium]